MSKIFIALDFDDLSDAQAFVDLAYPTIKLFKIGLQLCTKYGIEKVLAIFAYREVKIFLDLKFHDIPNTIAGSVTSVMSFEKIGFLTVHASSGKAGLLAAKENSKSCKILGVSVLTSFSEQDCQLIYKTKVIDKVLEFADLLHSCDIDGLVCSAQEAKIIRQYSEFQNLILVCPGIRIAMNKSNDQNRNMTLQEAKILI
jgi:orotidine-5'-phosphate decarboxylase